MLQQFKKFKIQASSKIVGGNSNVGGDLEIDTDIKGGVLNAAIGKGNVAETSLGA